jgi:cytochrome P450
MWLARLEVKVTLQELLKQVDSMSQIEPEAYLRSNFIRGIKHLKLRITTVA